MDRGPSGLDMVRDTVLDRGIHGERLGDGGIVLEECQVGVGVGRIRGGEREIERGLLGQDTGNRELGHRVQQSLSLHIHEDAEVGQKVRSQNGIGQVGNGKHPAEGAAKAEVQGERSCPVVRYGGVVNGLQAASGRMTLVSGRCRENAYVSTRIDEEASSRCPLSDEELALAVIQAAFSTCRRQC